jgi:sarcosine oxidase
VRYDAIVVGLGAMGAAALAALAGRGRRVLGIERFPLPHALGSSQGGTRIIREAYFEHPFYVPLVRRSAAAWQVLGARTGRPLLVATGGLTIGPPDARLVTGALASARTHDLVHDVLEADAVARAYPLLQIPRGHVAVRDPRAGVLLAARCLAALLAAARADGAELRDGIAVDGWDAAGDGVRVRAGGETLHAGRLVLAAGAWMPQLVPALAPHLRVERNVVHWFRPGPASAIDAAGIGPARLPVLVIEDAPDHLLYALPSMRALGDDLEDGVKFARHHSGHLVADAGAVDRAPSAADAAAIAPDVARYLPALAPAPVRSSVCCYTNTPDGHFVVDRHPAHAAVIVVSACSGHGFKFAPEVGRLVADLVADAPGDEALAPFSARRYSAPAGR